MDAFFCRRARCNRLLAPLALLAVAFLRTASGQAALDTGFINGTVEAGGRSMPYVVYVPRSYSEAQQWPVILFLHGSGERGTDGFAQVRVGIGMQLLTRPQQRFPCLVVMPQAPPNAFWTGVWNDMALRALGAVVEKYHGDRSRLYLTGLSMGGFGTWEIAAAHPELFAAAIPICGGGDPSTMAPKLKSLPIWVFHGGADGTVPVQFSRDMVAAIQAAGNPNIKYTEYPGVGHNSWDRTYGNPEVIAWLLTQKR
jgi:predicted peptidase